MINLVHRWSTVLVSIAHFRATLLRIVAIGVPLCVTLCLPGQTSVCMWGHDAFDTRACEGPCTKVMAWGYNTGYLRADGRLFIAGANSDGGCYVPALPVGRRYVDFTAGIGLVDDGSVLQWGLIYAVVPQAPVGMTYTSMSQSGTMLRRSDGALILCGPNQYGQATLPALPPGSTIVDFDSNGETSAVILSNGNLVVWGRNHRGQCAVPPLPQGLTYTDVKFGNYYTMALRSDGSLVAFGASNFPPVVAVPSLLPGTSYQIFDGGERHSVALRSDGVLVAWGDNSLDQCNVPLIPAGVTCTQVSCGQSHSTALLSDGRVLTWGFASTATTLPTGGTQVWHVDADVGLAGAIFTLSDGSAASWLANSVPQMPSGITYLAAQAGAAHNAGLLSDGRLMAWGDNTYLQCSIPILPLGMRYVDFALGYYHTVSIRSDGWAFAVGKNTVGQCNIPTLPAGLTYVDVDADYSKSILVRSDGQIVTAGLGSGTQTWQNPPPLPSGTTYGAAAVGDLPTAAIRSDGTAVEWSISPQPGYTTSIPALPTGVSYVEVDCNDMNVALRRSDGEVVMCGWVLGGYEVLGGVRPLEPGTSYLSLSAAGQNTMVRVGPTTTYVSFAAGCAGSRPATRLVPRDTPRIGRVHKVTLFDLPIDVAVLAMGLQPMSPVALDTLGMPGCAWRTSPDGLALLVGQSHQASWSLAIPDVPSLVGVHFYNQALVLDPAGNPFGAVVSDAAEGVVGYP